jgi:hypothetical protein
MAGSVIKDAAQFDGGHKFLAEELLQPMSDKCDVGRTNMWAGHFVQAVTLDHPERPRIFSRFEDAIGAYTTAVKVLPADAEIVAVFQKNALQSVYAIRYADGKMDVHFAKPVRHLTENYGYTLSSHLEGRQAGEKLPSGSVIQSWACTNEEGSFQFGQNLRTVYMNKDGKTYEDGYIIGESAADNMSHTSVEEVTVVLNANDLLVNHYSGNEEHQGFPNVGEKIKNGLMSVRRRINHESILFDLAAQQLGKIHWDADQPFYVDGTVVDIDVYSNLSAEELDKHPFNSQILQYHNKWLEFRDWFTEVFSEVTQSEGPRMYSDDVAYWWRLCRDTRTERWRHERREFDGVVIRFTVAKRNPVKAGSKLTNRFGGKGVVSEVRPDHLMPKTKDGVYAQLIVNSLGVVNRLNPAQLYESEVNYIGECVEAQMRAMPGVEAAATHFLKFHSFVDPVHGAFLAEQPELYDLVGEILRGEEHIYIHQPPFFGNISLDTLELTYKEFGVEKVYYEGLEEPQIPGTNYYLKLRHEPLSKMSARSAKHLSISGVPTKNSRGVRGSTEHHSTTPIRLGEQELQNLLIANQPDELKRLLRLYATDDLSREGAIAELLVRQDAFSHERIEPRGTGITRPVAGLKALLESIGLKLQTTGEIVDESLDDVPLPTTYATLEIENEHEETAATEAAIAVEELDPVDPDAEDE